MIRVNLLPSDFAARTGRALTLTEAYRGNTFWPDYFAPGVGLEVTVSLRQDHVSIERRSTR